MEYDVFKMMYECSEAKIKEPSGNIIVGTIQKILWMNGEMVVQMYGTGKLFPISDVIIDKE